MNLQPHDERRLTLAAQFVVATILAVLGANAIGTTYARGTGDFIHFFEAARAARDGRDLYTSGGNGYIYPPLLAVLFMPLVPLGLKFAFTAWTIISVEMTLLAVVLAARAFDRRFGGAGSPLVIWGTAAIALLLALDNAKAEFRMGQTDSIILLAFVLALCWKDRRPIAAGAALGVAANIKYLSLIVVAYWIVRGRWKAAASALASTVIVSLLPALVFGWSRNADYLATAFRGLGGMAFGRGDAAYAEAANIFPLTWHRSVSVTSAMARASEKHGLGTPGTIALTALAAGLTFAAVWLIYRRWRMPLFVGRGARPDAADPRFRALVALEWIGVIVATLAFGPQTTARHLFMLLPVHALAAYLLIAPNSPVKRWPLIAGVVLLQLGLRLPPGQGGFPRALEAWRAVGGASWCLLAMLLTALWVGLPRAARRSTDSPAPERTPGAP